MHKDTVCTEVILLIHFIKFEQKLKQIQQKVRFLKLMEGIAIYGYSFYHFLFFCCLGKINS